MSLPYSGVGIRVQANSGVGARLVSLALASSHHTPTAHRDVAQQTKRRNRGANMNTQHTEHAQQGAPEMSIGVASAAESIGTQQQQVAESSGEPSDRRRTALDVVLGRLAALQVGEAVIHERMVVFPLFAHDAPSALRYVTL